MPYTPKMGGYNWRKTVITATHKLKKQRAMLGQIVEGNLTQAELFQLISAIALINASITESMGDLLEFKDADSHNEDIESCQE